MANKASARTTRIVNGTETAFLPPPGYALSTGPLAQLPDRTMKEAPGTITVLSLYRRPDKNSAPQKVRELQLLNQVGIFDDCHAHTLSPRQVLIAFDNAYTRHELPDASLKENIRLTSDLEPNLESGDTLSVCNSTAVLRITFQCEPCGRLNKIRPNLCRDIKRERGILARVVSGGPIRVNDRLQLTKRAYPTFSDDWHQRVFSVAQQLPPQHYLSYAKLALLAGVAKSYCRAFPRLLKSHGNLPLTRIIQSDSSSNLPEWDGQNVFEPEP